MRSCRQLLPAQRNAQLGLPSCLRRRCRRNRRRAFTLLELLLVFVLLILVTAFSWPVLQSVYEIRRLKAVGDQVRAGWIEARNYAIDSGEPWAFRYMPETGEYQIASLQAGQMVGQPGAAGPMSPTGMGVPPGTATGMMPGAEAHLGAAVLGPIHERLPEGFAFAVGTTLDERTLQTTAPAGSVPGGGAGGMTGRGSGLNPVSGLGALGGGNAALGGWAAPILFYPDGTTSDAELIVTNGRGRFLTLSLRSTTGTSRASEVWEEDHRR